MQTAPLLSLPNPIILPHSATPADQSWRSAENNRLLYRPCQIPSFFPILQPRQTKVAGLPRPDGPVTVLAKSHHSSPGCVPDWSKVEVSGDQMATLPSLLPAPVMT